MVLSFLCRGCQRQSCSRRNFRERGKKSETESLLRKAMEDYETKMFLAQAKNITLGDMLDMWVEEELKLGSLSDDGDGLHQHCFPHQEAPHW